MLIVVYQQVHSLSDDFHLFHIYQCHADMYVLPLSSTKYLTDVQYALSVLRITILLTLNERGSLRERMKGGIVSLPTATDSGIELPSRSNPTDARDTRMVCAVS